VSVVVPCFNHGRFLREALLSIGTPEVPTEIIVVDDGSSDSTPEVVATFETTNHFRAVRQANAGLAAARNRGLRESRGRYIVFLDADDRLAPGAVEFGVARLQERPECAFVYGRCTLMDVDGTLLPTPEMPRLVRDHYREMLRRNYIWTPAAVMFRREPLERSGGFNADVNAAADYELYLHLARHYPVFDHAHVVAHYRKHEGSMSGNAGRMLRETLAVLRSQLPFLEGDEASLAAYREGWGIWQEFYGAHLANEIRDAVKSQRWIEVASKATVLGYYHPRGFWHHVKRKSELTMDALARGEDSAGRGQGSPHTSEKSILGRAENGGS
jgi:glycosyltransferase involved in cell wall biosynthesis